jgi:hypothetical protein
LIFGEYLKQFFVVFLLIEDVILFYLENEYIFVFSSINEKLLTMKIKDRIRQLIKFYWYLNQNGYPIGCLIYIVKYVNPYHKHELFIGEVYHFLFVQTDVLIYKILEGEDDDQEEVFSFNCNWSS